MRGEQIFGLSPPFFFPLGQSLFFFLFFHPLFLFVSFYVFFMTSLNFNGAAGEAVVARGRGCACAIFNSARAHNSPLACEGGGKEEAKKNNLRKQQQQKK